MTTTQEKLDKLVDNLVIEADKVIRYRAKMAFGEEPEDGQHNCSVSDQIRLLELAKPIIQKSQQARQIEAKSASDILKLLSEGKISINDAKTLMSLLKDKAAIDDLEEL